MRVSYIFKYLGDTAKMLCLKRTVLLVCDVQERFRGKIHQYDQMIANTVRMLKACNALGIPVVHTEQYPQSLGATVGELRDELQKSQMLLPTKSKTQFSMITDEVQTALQEYGCESAIICGIEAHVCVK